MSGKVFRGCSDTPSESRDKISADVRKQIDAFFAKGGSAQVIPVGVSADQIVGLREASARHAKQALGGAKSKGTNKPDKRSQIVLRNSET